MKIKDWDKVAEEYLELMEEPGKVGVVSDAASSSSGVARVARELAKKFSNKGHETVFYTIKGNIDDESRQELKNAGVEVNEIEEGSGIGKILDLKQIASIFEDDEIDFINAHGFYLPLAAVLSSVPVLKTYHAHITVLSEIRKHPLSWLKWVVEESPSIWFSEHRVSISKYAAKQMKRFYLRGSKVVYNGVDTGRFKQKEADYRERNDIPENAYLVGSLSALKEYKNQQKTLEIFAQEFNEEGNFLLIGGDGPRREKLEEKAKELGIESRTKFLGYVPEKELVDFYNAIDLFIYPSRWEGFGLPPIEAKLCGCQIRIPEPRTALKEIQELV